MMNFLTIGMLVILVASIIFEVTGIIIYKHELKKESKNKED